MKMPQKLCLTLVAFALLATSCQNEKHFLSDQNYREKVHEQFLKRKTEAENRKDALFSVLENENLTLQQKEALEFLYAYMPLSDLADYDGEFFLKHVDAAFKARDFFAWGKSIPEDIFRHFVLVYRVNNEYLDTARLAFFEELKERVKNLSMEEAALEVNHWCHEKVTYRGTDGRTSAPLALVRTAWGRCGEESTFTTAALRAVGIPARQCYTPRWVHTNDNHAWVEVWVNGKWQYLGACEPEPELNVAWFTAPAKRAMMVHTTVFGLYTGPEEKNFETPLYSRINLLENYAATRKVNVKVVNEQGNPVENADVKFKVYNYSELFPIVENKTDVNGAASITSGMGDVFVWAAKDGFVGYQKSTPQDESITITLRKTDGKMFDETFVMNPPEEQKIAKISSEKINANLVRLAHEDSVRNAYMSSFATEKNAITVMERSRISTSLNDPAANPVAERSRSDREIWKYLQLAQGNWREIEQFIIAHQKNPYLFAFLKSLREKDLRDTPAKFLTDHLQHSEKQNFTNIPEKIVVEKILSPRIALELIQPWRSFFQQKNIAEEIAGNTPNVAHIIDYIRKNITIKNDENYYNCYLTPRGVYELKMADERSRNVFFVAVCRSLNIPAQIDEATGKPQYYEKGKWMDAIFEPHSDEEKHAVNKATLTFRNDPSNFIKPEYYFHYTLAYYENGDFKTLDYENNADLAELPAKLELEEGFYRLMIGSRANDGSVTARSEYFELKPNQNRTITLKMPEITDKIAIRGSVDMNTTVTLDNNETKSLKELSNDKGLMLCFVDVGKEPSKHILQDLPQQQKALEAWNGGILLLIPDDKYCKNFKASAFQNLPKQLLWGIDRQRTLLKNITETLQIDDLQDNFPLTIYLSTNGGILYTSSGYRIGIGEDVVKTIKLEMKVRN